MNLKNNIYRAICKVGRMPIGENIVSDAFYLRCQYRMRLNQSLNLHNPQTYDEKLQWLKLYNRKPEYTTMVDKYEVRKYISEKIGAEYLIPSLGVWEKFEDIDFEKLPKQFVLKCTHDSGGLVICKDKAILDIDFARKKINKSLVNNYYLCGKEWPYKNVKPRIIAEAYMEDQQNKELWDYKFHCFEGKPFHCQVFTTRNSEEKTTADFYDMQWNNQKYIRTLADTYDSNSHKIVEKPQTFEEMKRLAEILSQNIPYVRVDFYEVDGQVYFGEITFYPAAGFSSFQPKEWEMIWGNMIDLSKVKK